MAGSIHKLWLGVPLLAVIATACAGIVGVEEPVLDPSALEATPEAGPVPVEEAGMAAVPPKPECSPTADNCPLGSYCLPTNDCAPGCKGPQDCTTAGAPNCNVEIHQCVQCRTEADCDATKEEKCSPAGACTTACGGPLMCSPGKTCCSTFCIDTAADPLNCGGCGTACSKEHSSATCTSSACAWTCADGYAHCGTANTGCESSLSAIPNCGGCGKDCSAVKNANKACQTGNVCGYTTCSSFFYDKDMDRTNGCEASCGDNDDECCKNGPECKLVFQHCVQGSCKNRF